MNDEADCPRMPAGGESNRSLVALLGTKYGDVDPLADVPEEHRAEAEKLVAVWSDAGRGDLRMLASVNRANPPPNWKRNVYARILARMAIRSEGRYRLAAMTALASVDDDFADISAQSQRKARRTR